MDLYDWGSESISPCDGDYFFRPYITEQNYLYQDVDIRDFPDGTEFVLSGYMNGWSTGHGDKAYLEMDFLDRRGRSLDKDSVCEPSVAGWDLYSFSMAKPAGAVTLRVSLIAERNAGSECDAYFDGVSLNAWVFVPFSENTEDGDEYVSTDVNDYEILWSNFNTSSVHNDAAAYITLNIVDELRLQSITTYHWNNGRGKYPGLISIREDGKEIGTWEAVGRPGSGVENVYWDVFPDIILEAGHSYDFMDSSPATWSCNSGSDGDGFLEIRGYFTDNET